MIQKPMLAAAICDETADPDAVAAVLAGLRYPVLATPKIDGIRTLMVGGRARSRSLKRVPNVHTRDLMECELPDGLDGEFWIPGTPFEEISGAWRRADGRPQFQYLVFDYLERDPYVCYQARMAALAKIRLPGWCQKLLPVTIESPEELLVFEEACLAQGWEGVMLRDPQGRYKFGRSTVREGWLLKFKRFADAEAKIIDFQELCSNTNAATKNALGHTERSGHRSGMVGQNTLGAFVCEGVTAFPGSAFNIGTGLTQTQREEYWASRESLRGRLVTFRYQNIGTKDAPRFPRFVGFRDPADM